MRLIDADALMPLFMKKANTMKDRHGVKLGEEWLLNYNDIKDVIDNAPTVEVPENMVNCVLTMFGKCSYNETGCSDCEIKDKIRKALERPQGEWIPVSERLPDLFEVVLVTDETGKVFEYERRPLDEEGNVCEIWTFLGRKIIAWMPLPEPYKEKEE